MTLTRKARVITFRRDKGRRLDIHSTGFTVDSGDKYVTIKGNQITDSEPHPISLLGNKNVPVDIGGPFWTIKNEYKDTRGFPYNPTYHINNGLPTASGTWKRWYDGPLYPVGVDSNGYLPYPPSAESSDSDLIALGTTAIARCKPTNSLADTAVNLAEIYREGIPHAVGISLWKDRLNNILHNAGSEYLNVVFGWLPLVSGIKDVANAMDQADKVWAQYKRDSGRLVRRKYEFPDETSVTVTSSSGNGLPSTPPGTSLTGDFFTSATGQTLTRTRTVTKKRWFSGAFVYYVPDEDMSGMSNLLYNASYMRKIYGVTLDPEVLWNLTPWSWAADWFVNAGDVISNISDMATDGLLMRYGYMMETSIVSDQYDLQHFLKGPVPNPMSVTLTTTVKKRIKASPYGFGLTYDGLSGRQKTIIAALGLTHFF